MNSTERLCHINHLLTERRTVPLTVFLVELGVFRATFKRDMEYLRDRPNASIIWDREAPSYRFEQKAPDGLAHELPEIYALRGVRVQVEGPESLKRFVAEEATRILRL